ncbi:MAG: thiolase domain-containing protein [Nanoarchaeota archaeon]|nr:thiolase domain-containing protein [Nanoarchaeota archaeon]MBU1004634.1 thiolase domain-containing protein [Nanoarchaeota archaeon]MBU1946188.1 thiolase domain-containing protein [Nanoarchaeota archaeon]
MERYVKGVGMTKFGIEDRPIHDMAHEAMTLALKDAGITAADIDAVVVSNVDTKINDERQRMYGLAVSSLLNRQMPIIVVPAVCGGGGAAFWTALRLKYNNILVLGVDRVLANTTPMITKEIMNAGDNFWEQEEGLAFPAINALVAQQHMLKYGTTVEDLNLIAYKNHYHGSLNPKARFFGKKVSLEEIKKSPIVASPFNLYDCSISVNGAAACVISNDKTDVKVEGSGLATDYLAPFEREDMTIWNATVVAGKEAFKQAKVLPSDINVAELHDAFTIVELIAYEDLGFCKKGEGGKFIRSGYVNLDGKMPVNTSGGLKARGHPISPTGVSQIVEIVDQLKGRCGKRQVKDAKLGLTHNIGGAGGTITVHIFRKL